MKTALVLIDIQNDYFPGGRMELAGSQEAAGNAARLLDSFRRSGHAIFHIRHLSIRPGSTFFLPGTGGADIHATVLPRADEPVIIKHYPNSFRDTELLERLRAEGIDDILACGMMTHMCVDATVRAAFDFGFTCTVARDACATRDLSFNDMVIPAAHVHASFMAALGAVYARTPCTDEILSAVGGNR